MALFRGAVSRDVSVMKLHCLLPSITCLPPLWREMCCGVLVLEGKVDTCVCVCVCVCVRVQNICCCMFVLIKGRLKSYIYSGSRRW